MAVDPKEIVQRNMVLAVCYAASLLALILYVVLVVLGTSSQCGDIAKQIKNKQSAIEKAAKVAAQMTTYLDTPGTPLPDNPIYCKGFTAEFNNQKAALKAQYDQVLDLYRNRQKRLEAWFPDKAEEYGDPHDKQHALSANKYLGDFPNELAAHVLDNHTVFLADPAKPKDFLVWGNPLQTGADTETPPLELMKKYNIQKAVIDDLDKGDKGFNPNHLLEPIHFDTATSSVNPNSNDPNKAPPKFTTIPVHVVFSASLKDVPKMVRDVLADDNILFRLKTLRTELTPFPPIKHDKTDGFYQTWIVNEKGDMMLYDKDIYDTAVQDVNAFTPDKEESVLPEPKVKVTLDLEAYDFKLENIIPPEGDQAQPGAPGQPGQGQPGQQPAPPPAP